MCIEGFFWGFLSHEPSVCCAYKYKVYRVVTGCPPIAFQLVFPNLSGFENLFCATRVKGQRKLSCLEQTCEDLLRVQWEIRSLEE